MISLQENSKAFVIKVFQMMYVKKILSKCVHNPKRKSIPMKDLSCLDDLQAQQFSTTIHRVLYG